MRRATDEIKSTRNFSDGITKVHRIGHPEVVYMGAVRAFGLSKFQDCLPEKFALRVLENDLLDVGGTVRCLAAASFPSGGERAQRQRVLRRSSAVNAHDARLGMAVALGLALITGCAGRTGRGASSPDTWSQLPAFESTERGRPFTLVIEPHWPIAIRWLRIGLDGTRFWEIRGPMHDRIEKPVEIGPGDHELTLVTIADGTGESAGYKFEVKSAHAFSPDVEQTTLVLEPSADGAALQDHLKVRWDDSPPRVARPYLQ